MLMWSFVSTSTSPTEKTRKEPYEIRSGALRRRRLFRAACMLEWRTRVRVVVAGRTRQIGGLLSTFGEERTMVLQISTNVAGHLKQSVAREWSSSEVSLDRRREFSGDGSLGPSALRVRLSAPFCPEHPGQAGTLTSPHRYACCGGLCAASTGDRRQSVSRATCVLNGFRCRHSRGSCSVPSSVTDTTHTLGISSQVENENVTFIVRGHFGQ